MKRINETKSAYTVLKKQAMIAYILLCSGYVFGVASAILSRDILLFGFINIGFISLGIGAVLFLISFLIAFFFNQCPSCGKILARMYIINFPEFCSKCGKRFKDMPPPENRRDP